VEILAYYILIVAGFNLALAGLRAVSRDTRIFTVLAGVVVLVATAFYFGKDIHRASDALRYGLSAVALVAGVQVITGRKPVRCALSLLVVFLALAGIFVSWQAEFLGAITISINAGAVVVSFLFLLMLIDLRFGLGLEVTPAWSAATAAVSLLFVLALLVGLGGAPDQVVVDGPPPVYFQYRAYGAGEVETRLGQPGDQEARAIQRGVPHALRPISGRTKALGWELYTRYTVPLEVASLILTMAVVAAVTIGRQSTEGEVTGDI